MFIAQTAIENTTSFCPKSDGCELAGGLEATNKKVFSASQAYGSWDLRIISDCSV